MTHDKILDLAECDIMIVDNAASDAESLVGILTDAGYRVRVAADGESAWRAAKEKPPTLVVSKAKMTGMDGYELCRRLKEDQFTRSTIMIFVFGFGEDVDKVKCFEVGGADYITNPLEPQEALARINTHLSLWSVKKSLELRDRELESRNIALEEEIGKRRKVELELDRSALQWRQTFDVVEDVIWLLDEDRRILRANKATESLFRLGRDEIVGKYCWEVAHGSSGPVEQCPLKTASARPNRQKFQLAANERWIEVAIEPITDTEGRHVGTAHLISDVTDRKAIEGALLQSRKSFASIVEESAEAILVVEASGDVLFSNPSATDLLEYDREGLVHNSFGVPAINDDVAEMQLVSSSGEIRDVEMRTSPIDWFGQPAKLVMLRDMTERQRHEQELRQAKELADQYLNVARVMLVILDTDGTVVRVNRKACEVLETEMAEILGRDWIATACPADCRDQALRVFEQTIKGTVDRYEYVEFPIVTAKGRRRLISWHNATLKDDNGSVVGTVSSGEDITNRKEMETLLAESEERYRLLVERSADAVLIARPDGKFITANEAAARLFGVDRSELAALNINDFYLNPEDRSTLIREVGAKETVKDFPVIMKQRNGQTKQCLVSSSIWKGGEGRIIGYLSMIRDVTEQRQLEEQLRQAQKMESIGTLAGGIAHDFNNILTLVVGYSELLLAEKPKDHADYMDLSVIKNAAERGAELVTQLLTFSRKVETKPKPLSLNKEVLNATKLLSRTIPKMIETRLNLADELRRIYADSGQVEQIILNLALNAKHAMPDGGAITFETSNIELDQDYCRRHPEAQPGAHVLLTIGDTGHGMSQTTMKRIFEPFFTTKAEGEGTGLGLAMVYGIVRNHGGHITCESEQGVGTVFKIYLPAIEEVVFGAEVEVESAPAHGAETILIVDDEELIRDLGQKLLEKSGYEVIQAKSGEEALEIYGGRMREIDLVILDLSMPGMGGYQALAELKKMDPGVRVVIASGYMPNTYAASLIGAEAAGFVSKPFNRIDLLEKLRNALDSCANSSCRD